MRKLFFMIMAVCFIFSFSTAAAFAAEDKTIEWLDTTKLHKGLVGITYEIAKDSKLKLLIKKDDGTYSYVLTVSNKLEYFPLQSNNGKYNIYILQNISGNKYKLLQSREIELKLNDPNSVFLGSIQNINWSEAEMAVQKAIELTEDKATVEDKVKAIYEYIIKEIDYDSKLAKKAPSNYIPNIDEVIKTKKGICYDYSSLFAAMTRSIGIPTKLVMGTTEYVKEYHAWNSVYIKGKWITVDTTYDAGKNDGKSMIKDSSKYKAARVY